MNKRNYQKELEQIITQEINIKRVPSLLLHSCCAPCSSYVLAYLSQYFNITICFYNPNIYPLQEYEERVKEQERLIGEMNAVHPVKMLTGNYNPEEFYATVKGLEQAPEGSERCYRCYELRLEYTAHIAAAEKYDYFTTTLSISPMKNAVWLNEIGERLAQKHRIKYLNSDFKKKEGYKRSIELSKKHSLYRQDYCGCIYSLKQRQNAN